MDGDLKSRQDIAIQHLYFVDWKNKLLEKPEVITENVRRASIQIKNNDSSGAKNFYGIFDFLFRNYLFRKYKISNLDIIRFNFLEIDKDSSGDINLDEFVEKGTQMLGKDRIELKEKYESFRKFCSIIDYDAYVCSNARYESESVLD